LISDDELEKLKGEIISSMAKIEDTHHRVVLSFMIRIMSTQERFITEIYNKLDGIIQDEKRIKEIVLNGHVDEHVIHHNWIRSEILEKTEKKSENKKFFRSTFAKIITVALVFILGFHAQKFFPQLFGGHINAPSSISDPHPG